MITRTTYAIAACYVLLGASWGLALVDGVAAAQVAGVGALLSALTALALVFRVRRAVR